MLPNHGCGPHLSKANIMHHLDEDFFIKENFNSGVSLRLNPQEESHIF
jgi:hypothetical protein